MRLFAWMRPVDQIERASHTIVWLVIAALALQVLFQWPILVLIALIIGALRTFTRKKLTGDTFGSARWADYLDLKNAGCLIRNGVHLGRMLSVESAGLSQVFQALFYPPWRTQEALAVLETRRSNPPTPFVHVPDRGPPHLAVVGASGSGKSTCFAIPNLVVDPTSAVVLDPKGELAALTGWHRKTRFGHDVVVIDPFGIAVQDQHRSRFNPFSLYRGDPKTLVDECRRLANALVVRQKEEREPFFNSGAQVVIQTIIAFLLSEAKPEDATLNRLRDIATNPKVMRELLEHLEQSEACNGILRRLAGNVRWYQGQTEASIYAVANTHLEFLDSQPISEALSETTFDPEKLINGKMTIYLCLPVDRIQELKGLQRIMLTSLINLIFRAGESRDRRVRFYLDEAVSLGEIEALYSALVYGRSYGIRLMFFFQSTSQVPQCFPDSKAADFQATVASVFCGVNDYRTAQEVSQWIGQTTVESQSCQTSDNWGHSWNQGSHDHSQGGNYGGGTSTTYTQVGRALIQPEEVLQLPSSMAVALLPGMRPVLLEKTPYYQGSASTPPRSWRLVRALGRTAAAILAWILFMLMLRSLALGNFDLAVKEAEAVILEMVGAS